MTPFLVLHGRKSVNCLCQIFCGLKCLTNLELIEWKAGCLWEACFPCAAISVCLFCVTFLKQKSYEEKDQCIPCDVSVWGSGVMDFVGKERMVGYGIYWVLIEYLWVRDNYVGDVGVVKACPGV